jgi:gliding motility-associated lipoprotein GldB
MNKFAGILLLSAVLFSACQRNPLKPDITSIKLNIRIIRLDQDLFKITSSSNQDSIIPAFEKKYGDFFTLYNKNVLRLGDPHDAGYAGYLQQFLSDSITLQTKRKIDSTYNDLHPLEEKLEKAFRYYKYHFPSKPIPHIYSIVSGFNQSMVTTTDALGISLDNYLGENCRFYSMLSLPDYKKMNMTPEKIPTDALYAWAISEFEPAEKEDNLIAAMIGQGKIMYFLDAVFPDEPDYIKIGYKPDKIEWCRIHENAMWTYLIENKLLFDNSRMNMLRFTGPGPFTNPYTAESPGKAGVWIGWQIVRKYMKKHPEVSVSALMKENDYQKILNESGYDPQ